MLATRADGLRNIFGLSRGQHKNYVTRWLLKGLQQSIEGSIGNLMGLVENVDLEAIAGGPISSCFAQFTDLINAAVGSGVNLNHIHRIPGAYFGARLANSTRLRDGLVRRAAVQRHGQDTSDRGFADASVATKNVPMSGPLLLDGVFQGPGNMFLPDDLGEFLRTVLTRQDLVAHG